MSIYIQLMRALCNPSHVSGSFSVCSTHLHHGMHSLLLSSLVNQTLMDVWDNTSSSNGSLDQRIQLLISSDGKLQMSWCNSLHLKILGCVTSQLENLCTTIGQRKVRCDVCALQPDTAPLVQVGLGHHQRRASVHRQTVYIQINTNNVPAVRYSRIAAEYTAAVAPTRPLAVERPFKRR